jgi:hypothetical protein
MSIEEVPATGDERRASGDHPSRLVAVGAVDTRSGAPGPDELLRAILPAPTRVRHERAVMTFLEGLSLWLDATLPVVLSVDARQASFCLGLTDELGLGARSV